MKKCRFCDNPLSLSFCDLGKTPLSNAYLGKEQLLKKENFFPLHAYVCSNCLLVQLEEVESPENIFQDYAYFSSFSKSWLEHSSLYVDKMIERFGFNENSQVVELASNDGYLLQYFKNKNVPVLGIEPAANVAEIALKKGIPTIAEFFGSEFALELVKKHKKPDLLLGNNVLAHVPNLNDFVKGMKILLDDKGIITMEFPHLLNLMKENQFDTIYHEHFSYFSFFVVEKVFAKHGLTLFDVDKLKTHGGSLRIYAKHDDNSSIPISESVSSLKEEERNFGLNNLDTYVNFQQKIDENKQKLLDFLTFCKENNKKVIGYGAPAKGNTLLNYYGINTDLLNYTVDRSPYKQGRFLPGTHLPIKTPDEISKDKPDFILILPWNLREEIIEQMSFVKDWGAKFIIPIPELMVL
jgi:hypothetical protein